MAEIRTHEFDRFIASAKTPYRLFLVYGPDRGLVSERAAALAERTGVSISDPFAVVRLDGDVLKTDPGRLIDEVNAAPLFGGERLIWLRTTGNDRALPAAVAAIADDPPGDATVIIEAGELKKGAPLRKAVEGSPGGLAVPCYVDERRGIQALIDEELAKERLSIAPAARERLAGLLGGDRLASRSELRKLALYCRGNETISDADVIASVGDAAAVSIDEAVDAVLLGDPNALDQALRRIIASKTAVSTVLLACLRQFQLLDGLRAEMSASDRGVSQIMATEGRRIHFRRKPAVEAALRDWLPPALAAVLDHFQQAILEIRRRPRLEDDIARYALMAAALRSARNRGGRI